MRRLLRGITVIAAAFGLALAALEGASAASFAVEPSTFTLVLPIRNATITLTNLSSAPLRLQVGGFAWSEDEAGTFRLAATSNVVVFPQLVTIPPLGVQRVRAAFVAAASSNEQAFRIVIEDIPSLDETIHAAPGANISIRTRFTLPVYVEPVTRVRSARIQGAEVRNGKLSFSLINSGNTHLSGSSLNVDGRDGAGKTVFASKIEEWHVLAGASRIYTVEISKSECAAMRKLTISAGDSRMLTAQTVDVASCT